MLRLFIVRHGETDANVNQITQGHLNSQLTEEGKKQIALVAERLQGLSLDHIYASDLDRAFHTAQAIHQFHPEAPLEAVPALRERCSGIYEGQPREVKKGVMEASGEPSWEWIPEGGESFHMCWNRVIGFYEEVIAPQKGKTIMLVSHSGAIGCLLAYLHEKPIQEMQGFIPKTNTAVTEVEVTDTGKCFLSVNCSVHL